MWRHFRDRIFCDRGPLTPMKSVSVNCFRENKVSWSSSHCANSLLRRRSPGHKKHSLILPATMFSIGGTMRWQRNCLPSVISCALSKRNLLVALHFRERPGTWRDGDQQQLVSSKSSLPICSLKISCGSEHVTRNGRQSYWPALKVLWTRCVRTLLNNRLVTLIYSSEFGGLLSQPLGRIHEATANAISGG